MQRSKSAYTSSHNVGDRVDRYSILKLLGKGASGEVFLVKEDVTQCKYAMKVVGLPDRHRSSVYTRLKREIDILKKMDDSRIVKLYRVLKGTSSIFLICEYVSGGDLFDRIALDEVLSEADAKHYFKQTVEGLLYCHTQGVYHRDIKPENIMITASDDVKIADFGLSRVKTPTTVLFDTMVGTLNYVAPELLQQKPYDAAKCDVWSMGIMLFVMLSGRFPYDSDSDETTARMILRDGLVFPDCIESALARDLMSKMLRKSPEARLTMERVAEHPWLIQY